MFGKRQKASRFTVVNQSQLSAKDIETIFQSIELGDLRSLLPFTMHLTSTANILHPKYKLTIVQYAAMAGQLGILQWLIEQGIVAESSLTEYTVDSNGNKDVNAILIAAMNGRISILEWLHSRFGSPVLSAQRSMQQELDMVLLAATYGHLELFKWLVAHDYSVSVRDRWGNSPLLCAAMNGRAAVVKWIVELLKVPLDVKNSQGDGIISHAAANGHLEILDYAYSKKPLLLNEVSAAGLTPAMYAASYNKLNILQWLCEKQGILPIVAQRAKDGTTVFTAALSHGGLSVFQWLVAQLYGNSYSPDLYKFLHFAARKGQLEIVKWLITTKNLALDEKTMLNAHSSMNGALLEWLTQYQQSQISNARLVPSVAVIASMIEKGDLEALKMLHRRYPLNKLEEYHHIKIVQYAAMKGQLTVLQWLISDIFSEFSLTEGENAILLAVSGGHVNVVQWMHQQFGRQILTAQYKNDYDVVLLAAYGGHLPLLKWFYAHNYSFDVRAKTGLSPLTVAIQENHYQVVEWLLNEGPNAYELIRDTGNVQQPPVWLATQYGYLEILQLLDQKGYRLDHMDVDGDTILHLAAMNGFSHIVFWLVKEKQFSFNAVKNRAGYTPAACAMIMGRYHLLRDLCNDRNLDISVTEPADSFNLLEETPQNYVVDFIKLLQQFSKEQPYQTHNKKFFERKVRIPAELLFMLISFLHHHDASLLSDRNIQQLCRLSENNLKRISILVENLAKHHLLNNLSFTSALQRIQTKIISSFEASIAQRRVSEDQLKTQTTLTDGHSFWMNRDMTLFARGGQGTIRQAYLSPNDVEPAYCVKQIQSGVVPDLKEAARREAKCHGLFSRTALFFSEGESAYVVSSWQPGQALGRFSREQLLSLPFDTRLKCIITALRDLNELHLRYRTYNDIKPLNFILDVQGQAMRLIDFGSTLKHGSTKKMMFTELYRDPVHKTGFLNDTYGMGLIIAVLFPDLFAASFVSDSSQLLVNPGLAAPKHKAIIKLVQALIDKDIEKRCTIADALNYSELLMESLSSLDEAKLDDIAFSTIYRTNPTMEDVFRDARISRN